MLAVISTTNQPHAMPTTPETDTMKAAREAEERRRSIIKLAKKTIEKEGSLEIDSDAEISEGDDNGAYVQAWVWLPFDNTEFDKEEAD